MCGIAGIANRRERSVPLDVLARMAAALRHRGPDGYGFYVESGVGFAHVRLSVVDLDRGQQPLANEDGRVVVTYNGEIYNHPELRRDLEACGHVFRTRSDTEVLVHAYEQWGPRMLERLNGQFAFAIHDARDDTVFLARDRFGVRPLVYTQQQGQLLFASEAKALLATGAVDAQLDAAALDEVLLFWAPRAPRTAFAGISSLEPGTYAIWRGGRLHARRYHEIDFPESSSEPEDAIARLDALLRSAVDLRLRADVPVGSYLSGGLDSSIASVLAAAGSPHRLRTFSITFDDPSLDESLHQKALAELVGSEHTVAAMTATTIGKVFPDVVRHAETPLVRTAAAPMFELARRVKNAGLKVVLTGEGADELFLGYDLFKEVSVRRFCLRRPESRQRPRLFDRLYPYLADAGKGGALWRQFFLDAGPVSDPLFSHVPRARLGAWTRQFYDPSFAEVVTRRDSLAALRQQLPTRFFGWTPLNQAAYLEMTLLLSGYLLSSQGDRMSMAHGVESRYPFLDHRLFDFAAALPTGSRLRGLKEKEILRRWARQVVPRGAAERPKQPYRAPDAGAFFGARVPEYVEALLSREAIARNAVWSPHAVSSLVRRCKQGRATTTRENQALVSILSTQLWLHWFGNARAWRPDPLSFDKADVLLGDLATVAA